MSKAKLSWKIIHECDDEDTGEPTCWSAVIDNPMYGKYVWITNESNTYNVEVLDNGEFKVLKECKSFTSAKRWVNINLLRKGD